MRSFIDNTFATIHLVGTIHLLKNMHIYLCGALSFFMKENLYFILSLLQIIQSGICRIVPCYYNHGVDLSER